MPSTSKNISIGILVTGAFLLLLWVLFFLHPSFGDSAKTIRVRCADINKIDVGTKVTFAGRPVGEVAAIQEVSDARNDAHVNAGQIYPYELTCALDSSVTVYDSDEVVLRTEGLMGERFVAIIPRRPKEGIAKPLPDNAIVYAMPAGSVEDAFREVQSITQKAGHALDTLSGMLQKNSEQLQETLITTNATAQAIGTFFQKANDLDVVTHIDTAVTEGQKTCTTILEKLNSRDGTIGKLLNDDTLYLKSFSVLNKCDVLFSDLNRYGVLYHLDKGWQRQRRREIAEIARLENPAEFKNYINEEMQKITISIDRVEMALNKAQKMQDSEERKEILRAYQALLTQIQELEKTLQMQSTAIDTVDNGN